MKAWIKRISRRDRVQGEILPPWYYGLAFVDYAEFSCIQVFYVIPINYIIKAWAYIRYGWNRIRSKRTWMDWEIIRGIIRYEINNKETLLKYKYNIKNDISDGMIIIDKIRNGCGDTRILADELECILKKSIIILSIF